jgi:hypothetical protein
MQNTEPEEWILGKGLEDWEKVEGDGGEKEGQQWPIIGAWIGHPCFRFMAAVNLNEQPLATRKSRPIRAESTFH